MSDPEAPQTAEPVRLEYAPPVHRSRTTTLVIGILASIIYAVGGGFIAFGLMLGVPNDREAPVFVAAGVTAIILASGLLVTVWFSRR